MWSNLASATAEGCGYIWQSLGGFCTTLHNTPTGGFNIIIAFLGHLFQHGRKYRMMTFCRSASTKLHFNHIIGFAVWKHSTITAVWVEFLAPPTSTLIPGNMGCVDGSALLFYCYSASTFSLTTPHQQFLHMLLSLLLLCPPGWYRLWPLGWYRSWGQGISFRNLWVIPRDLPTHLTFVCRVGLWGTFLSGKTIGKSRPLDF